MDSKNKKRFILYFTLAIIVLTSTYISSQIAIYYLNYTSRLDDQNLIGKDEALRRSLIASIQSQVNISSDDLEKGFWYSYTDKDGNENMYYFDLNSLVGGEETAAQFIERFKNSQIIKNKISSVSETQLPSEVNFHNTLISPDSNTPLFDLRDELLKKLDGGSMTSDDLSQLSYIYELQGDYSKRDYFKQLNCKLYKIECVNADKKVTISGKIVDQKGDPVAEASVVVLGTEKDSIQTLTNINGQYSLLTSVNNLQRLRIRATKRNYSEGFSIVQINPGTPKKISADDIILSSPINIVTFDTEKGTITGSENAVNKDGSITIHTQYSTYDIPKDAIVDSSGKPYKGSVDIYLYEFEQGTIPQSLSNLDTFDAIKGYAGNLMKSFGMPYIQFYTTSGVELDVLKSNPMRLTYQIRNMKELYDNKLNIYTSLTDADMDRLVAASHSKPYSIDRNFLINNNLLQFPAFWVLDRGKGVWENVGISVLSLDGLIQSVFYTKDNI